MLLSSVATLSPSRSVARFAEVSPLRLPLAPAAPVGDWAVDGSPESWPSVSVVMISHERRHFLPHALASIAAQDYPASRLEVSVVDDSAAAGAAGWSAVSACPAAEQLERLRFLHAPPVPRRAALGAKRNAALSVATGELVAVWDDDDFYSPCRLRQQAAALRSGGGADVCMLDDSGDEPTLHYFDASLGAFSAVSHSPLAQPCAMMCLPPKRSLQPPRGTLLTLPGGFSRYRRSLWGRGASRYPPGRDTGEDLVFFDALLAHGAKVVGCEGAVVSCAPRSLRPP